MTDIPGGEPLAGQSAGPPSTSPVSSGATVPRAEGDDQLIGTALTLIGRLQEGKASKKTVALVAASLALDFCLTGLFAYNQVAAHDAQVSQCQQNNMSRLQDHDVMTTLINDLAPPGTKLTARQAAEVRELEHKIDIKDQPRDCDKIYGYF